ncbi:MAG: LPP20 family lipoprotein [Planctomycetota bacterium]
MRIHPVLAAALAAVLLTACIPGIKKKEAAPKAEKYPAWVNQIPKDDQFVYAVGYSGRTMNPTDSMKYARENARKEMASMIKTSIVSVIETQDFQRHEDVSMESISVTDEDLQGSEVIEQWVDRTGVSGGNPGTTYVLLRLDRATFNRLLGQYRGGN